MAKTSIKETGIQSIMMGRHVLLRAANLADANSMLDDAIKLVRNSDEDITCHVIRPDKGSIGISDIREVQSTLSLKSMKNERVVIAIYDATTMSIEAQNSLLKSLEDSNRGKQFILAGDYGSKLLLTIVSRTDVFDYIPPSELELSDSDMALFRASGYSKAALDSYKTTPETLETAKVWLKSDITSRIAICKEIKTQESAQELLAGLMTIYTALLHSTYSQDDKEKTKNILNKIDLLSKTEGRLSRQGNIKLNLSQLSLSI